MPIHRVTQPYQSAYPDPIILKQGETLTTSDRQTDWPGWIWCTTASGESRWVPDAFVNVSPGQATMRRDYNPIELNVQPGDRLTAIETINGWAWCADAARQQGWVPQECLQPLQDPT